MNEENSSSSTSLNEDQQSKEPKKRVSSVSKDLKSMIDFVAKIYNQLGHTTYHSNKAIAAVQGLAVESIKGQLGCTQQYKLLEIKHGVGYKITDHFQKLYLPKNDNEKRNAVIESLKTPETYQQLFTDYEYHVVPFEGVKNHFIRHFQFKEDIAAKAAQIFMDNLKDYDLLDGRGVLTSAMPSKPITPDVRINHEELKNSDNPANEDSTEHEHGLPATTRPNKFIFQSELNASGNKTIPVYLTGGKNAMLVYPDDIDEDDIELLKHQIDGVLLRIKLEAKKRASETKKGD